MGPGRSGCSMRTRSCLLRLGMRGLTGAGGGGTASLCCCFSTTRVGLVVVISVFGGAGTMFLYARLSGFSYGTNRRDFFSAGALAAASRLPVCGPYPGRQVSKADPVLPLIVEYPHIFSCPLCNCCSMVSSRHT